MARRYSLGWLSLLAWCLIGQAPTTHGPAASGDQAVRPAEGGQAPVRGDAAPIDRFPVQSLRQGSLFGAVLPPSAFRLAHRLATHDRSALGWSQPVRRTRVGFPRFPTGPPLRG
jgi:hypothetical protein